MNLPGRFFTSCAAWLVLTGNDPGTWVVAPLAGAAAAALSCRLMPPARRPGWRGRLHRLASLVGDFATGSLRGGIDVAMRALHPQMPVRPGWVRHRLALSPGPRRMLLGDLISLMPGSLAAGETGARDAWLLVHCLDTDQPVARELGRHEACLRAWLDEPADGPEDRHA